MTIKVKLFCDWQSSSAITNQILEGFRWVKGLDNNIYKDIEFSDDRKVDIALHVNYFQNEYLTTTEAKENIVIGLEPPEFLTNLEYRHENVDYYFINGNCWDNFIAKDKVFYQPLIYTFHAEPNFTDLLPSSKSKFMSCVMSSKFSTPEHRRRLLLMNQIKDSHSYIDFYGLSVGKRLDKKVDALNDYTYSIAFENSLHKGNLSEKFYDCIANNTIPLTNNKTAFDLFDENSFIYIDPRFSDAEINGIIRYLYKEWLDDIYGDVVRDRDKSVFESKQKIFNEYNIIEQLYQIVHKIV